MSTLVVNGILTVLCKNNNNDNRQILRFVL